MKALLPARAPSSRQASMGLGTWLLRLAIGAVSIGSTALALLYFFQERLLYVPKLPGVPDDYSLPPPDRYGLNAEDITLTASDGVKLHGWMLTVQQWTAEYVRSRPVILFFQENAGNMSLRLPFLRLIALRLQCPIFAVSYRGYGLSGGRPSEKGIQRDAEAALAHVKSRTDVDGSRVVVYGRSLGGAVAIHLAATHGHEISAIVVENAFTCVEDMVRRVVPPLGGVIGPGKPLNFLVTNKWYNTKKIAMVHQVPILMIVSELDEMVPADHMYQLYMIAKERARVCDIVTMPGAHHMDAHDVCRDLYWGAFTTFMDKYVHRSGRIAR